jgi:DNA (cytosine-5)-methyltransferase 1
LDFETVPLGASMRWPTAAWNVGEGRTEVHASEWPCRRQYASLESFLKYATTPLSAKATAGFLKRTDTAKLRFPPGFIDAIRLHLERMGDRAQQVNRDAVDLAIRRAA